jgi:uncharacterized protein YbjT (DUF2867 family)
LTNTVIRPANFYENYAKGGVFKIEDGVLPAANAPNQKVQAVGVRDIGLIAAEAFLHPEEYHGQVIELSAEDIDGNETAAIYTRVTGKQTVCKQMFIFKLGCK